MMMRMLEAGGLEVLTDGVRRADEDNPRGYYEFEPVKHTDEDASWLEEAEGRAVKMVSQLLYDLPPEHTYKVVFMRRRMEEILASQHEMLVRRGEVTDRVSDAKLAELFRKHLQRMASWLDEAPSFEVLNVSYNDVLDNPVEEAERINRFFGGTLDVEAMAAVVDRTLYRQRR
jgi:argonaute-like protein implicated in RNA metabolism and viral defense